MNSIWREVSDLHHRFAANWTRFLAVHLAMSLLGVILLVPAAALLLRLAVSLSGTAALSDLDILFFMLSPVGFLSLIVVGAVYSIILFLEYASLLTVARFAEDGKRLSLSEVFDFLLSRMAGLFSLAVQLLLRVLLTVAPFLLLLALVYFLLLSEYDINYYLSARPPEWRQALAVGGLISAAGLLVLIRFVTGWMYCLPLLLFNGVSAANALSQSRQSARGRRFGIVAWLLGWLVLSILAVTVSSGLVALAGNHLLPLAAASLPRIVLAMAMLALVGFLLSFMVSFVSSVWLSLLILKLFNDRGLGRDSRQWTGKARDLTGSLFIERRVLIWASLAGAVIAILIAHGLLGRLPEPGHASVVAHRGASAAAPENTLAAIRAAIESGAGWVEIDVQETADGKIVVIHDSDLKKVGGVPLSVGGAALQDLQQVDIGSWFDPAFSSERVPTLQQALALCKDRIGVNIELKYYGHEQRLEGRVAEIVEAAGMAEQVVVMSLNYGGIMEMRRIRPDWRLGLLSSVALGNLVQLDVDFLALNGRAATRRTVREAHLRGKQILVWTINDDLGMATMLGRGVDGIITDEPALGVSVLEQFRGLSPSERLLIQLADLFDQPSLYGDQ